MIADFESEGKMARPHVPELVVYTGPMWSGKTESVKIELKLARIAGISTIFFRPEIDTRVDRQMDPEISKTIFVSTPMQVLEHVCDEHQWVAFDEIHFFEKDHEDFVRLVKLLVRSGRRVLVAGLDLDYTEKPFMITANLMALAQHVYKKHAICQKCKAIDVGSRSQRISDATDRFVVGDKTDYEPRCLECYVPPNGISHSHEVPSTEPLPS